MPIGLSGRITMRFENTVTFGFGPAFRGMGGPAGRGVCCSSYDTCSACPYGDMRNCEGYFIGETELELAQRLIRKGSGHREFLHQIQVWVDITAPLHWWMEAGVHMPGVTANDCGASRLLAETPITGDSFEFNGMENRDGYFLRFIQSLEDLRAEYNRTGNKALWDSLIRQLPGSWLQTRTVNMNYENLRSVVHRGDGSGAGPSYSAGAACLSAARREHDE